MGKIYNTALEMQEKGTERGREGDEGEGTGEVYDIVQERAGGGERDD